MSAAPRVIQHCNAEGVLLRYHPDQRGPHHLEQWPQVADSQRVQLIKAERALLSLWVIAEHLNISDIGMTRIANEIETIRRALEFKRRDYGMAPNVEVAV
jgi:hypothetical protein